MSTVRTHKKRKRSRKQISLVLKVLCGVGVAAALTMGATVFFRAEQITVTGNSHYTQEEIISTAGIKVGDNLFHMNKYRMEEDLCRRLPYLEEVSIRRQMPNGVLFEVQEWGAAALVLPNGEAESSDPADGEDVAAAPPDPAEEEGDTSAEAEDPSGSSGAADASGDQSAQPPEEEQREPARESWLISSGGKLLEAPTRISTAIRVSGLTILEPERGTMVQVPQKEALKLSGLLELLEILEDTEQLEQVSAVEVGSTALTFHYLDRFDVKIPLNADFAYKMNFLQEMVRRLDQKHGESCRGEIDLSREDYGGAYLPEA